MGNIKNCKWYLILFYDEEKTTIYKILRFENIRQMSYIIGLNQQIVSNFYHKLIKPRGVLKLCSIVPIK